MTLIYTRIVQMAPYTVWVTLFSAVTVVTVSELVIKGKTGNTNAQQFIWVKMKIVLLWAATATKTPITDLRDFITDQVSFL